MGAQSTLYNPRDCRPEEGRPKRYCGRPLHNPDPTSPECCWVEFYGFCLTDNFLSEFAKTHIPYGSQHQRIWQLDIEVQAEEAIKYIRKSVKHMLQGRGTHIADDTLVDHLPTYTYLETPSFYDRAFMSAKERSGEVNESLFSVVIYWATNETPQTLDRVNGEGTEYIKETLREVLDLEAGAEPTWWAEETKIRFEKDIREFYFSMYRW